MPNPRYRRPLTRAGGNRGPFREEINPPTPIDPVPADVATPRQLIKTRSGGGRGTPPSNPRDGRGPTNRRAMFAYKMVRCDNTLPEGQQEIIYLSSDIYRNLPVALGNVYKIFTNNVDLYGCFQYLGPQHGSLQEHKEVQVDNAVSQCGDCDIDHGQAFTVTDCNDNDIVLANDGNRHGNDFQIDDLIEVTIDGAASSVCVIVKALFDLEAGEDAGLTYTFQRVVGGANETCTACDLVTGYLVVKCDDPNTTYYVDDPQGTYQASWQGEVHEFSPDGGGANYCAVVGVAESGWAIDVQNSSAYTATIDTRVQFRGANCAVCDDIDGYIIAPCDGGSNYFVEDLQNDGASIVGNVYFFNHSDPNTDAECYTISQEESAQAIEIVNSTQYLDGRGILTRAALKVDCQDCIPVLGCTDEAANNYDPNADIDDGSCVFPPINPVQLIHWGTDYTGTFSNTQYPSNNSIAVEHGAFTAAGVPTLRWYSDPYGQWIGCPNDQTQDGGTRGWYVAQKPIAGNAFEWGLAFAGSESDCNSMRLDIPVSICPMDATPAPTPPATAAQVEWAIVEGPFRSMMDANASLLGHTGGGQGLGGTRVGAVRVKPCKEYYQLGDPHDCWNDDHCYFDGATASPAASVSGGWFDVCNSPHGDDDDAGPCPPYIIGPDYDIRASFVAANPNLISLSIGDIVVCDFAPTITGQSIGFACEVTEVGLWASGSINNYQPFPSEAYVISSSAQTCLETIRTLRGDPTWGATSAFCIPDFEWYKVETCGVAGQFVYMKVSQNDPDHPFATGTIVSFNLSGGINGGGIACGTVQGTVTEAFYESQHMSLHVNYNDQRDTNLDLYGNCDHCINGPSGGGGGGSPIIYDVQQCAGTVIDEVNSAQALSVGDVILYSDTFSDYCGTVQGPSDSQTGPTPFTMTTAFVDCTACLSSGGGGPP